MAKASTNWTETASDNSSQHTGRGVVIDLGTGDGRFVYQSARQDPSRFFIGIDASSGALEKVSEKIHRKPAKGGLKNAMFIQAAVESLPEELSGVANEVHIHFPWGSLLRAVALGDLAVLRGIRRLCTPDAFLEIIIGLDEERDRTEFTRLGLQPLTSTFVETSLVQRYADAGFKLLQCGQFPALDWPNLCTSWAQKLRSGSGRRLVYIIGQAVEM